MKIKELVEKGYKGQLVEIASPNNYYFGKVTEIPKEMLDYEVTYLYAGFSDTVDEHGHPYPNVLCMDAIIDVDITEEDIKIIDELLESNTGDTIYSIKIDEKLYNKLKDKFGTDNLDEKISKAYAAYIDTLHFKED